MAYRDGRDTSLAVATRTPDKTAARGLGGADFAGLPEAVKTGTGRRV
jgi:hypothetical protein